LATPILDTPARKSQPECAFKLFPFSYLQAPGQELTNRLNGLAGTRAQIAAAVEETWEKVALDRAPGSLILDCVARRYDVRFSKESGDSARLARLVSKEAIPDELRQFLQEVTAE
jgi:hypothetical protein